MIVTEILAAMMLILFPPQEEEVDPVLAAFEAFEAAPEETQIEILAKIHARMEESDDETLKSLLALGKRAQDQLKTVPKPKPEYNDPRIYAPGLYNRRFADPEGSEAGMVAAILRPWESAPIFSVRIEYDFGMNAGLDSGKDPSPPDLLWNLLHGYPLCSDLVVAWLNSKWDFDDKFDAHGQHFAHVYCDLNDTCYSNITLYDAFASQEGIDMPDVDVIAYARNIMNNDSYKSPLPPNRRRQRLYEKIKAGFLDYFQHRTWIDAAANLYVNPEAELRPVHEPLRKRLLYAFALDGGDVNKIRARFQAAGSRNGFIRHIDDLIIDDNEEDEHRDQFTGKQNAARWAVAKTAHAVLEEYGLLHDGE